MFILITSLGKINESNFEQNPFMILNQIFHFLILLIEMDIYMDWKIENDDFETPQTLSLAKIKEHLTFHTYPDTLQSAI